ncbi:MAG: hypothetical protein LBS60_05425 [Deltaproteobacteria bacterium]|jgi:hypothetical protein|nr:hypothetical protein [Deltaproteobacteria bacterium]
MTVALSDSQNLSSFPEEALALTTATAQGRLLTVLAHGDQNRSRYYRPPIPAKGVQY